MTRRALTLAAPAALLAQTPQQSTAPSSQAPEGPAREFDAAREGQRRSAAELAKVPLAMAVEPACHFKA